MSTDAELTVEIDRCVGDYLVLKARILAAMEEIALRKNDAQLFLYSKGFYFIACSMVLVDKAMEAKAPPNFVESLNARFEELLNQCPHDPTIVQDTRALPNADDDEWPDLLPDTPIL